MPEQIPHGNYGNSLSFFVLLYYLEWTNGAHRKIRTFDLSLTKGVLYP